MFRTQCQVLLMAGLVFCLAAGTQVSASVLMLDTFDSASPVDINSNVGAPRQSGSLVPTGGIAYTKVQKASGNAAAYTCNDQSGPNEPELLIWAHYNATTHGAWQDQNETSLVGGSYEASVRMDAGTSTSWSFLAVSETQDNLSSYLPKTGVVADIQPDGTWEFFVGGVSNMVASGTITAASHYDMKLAINEGGSSPTASLIVDGTTLATHALMTWGSGDRYLGIGANMSGTASTQYFDNLRLDTPEPSSMVLMALAAVGLLAYAWRKRR
jgi:hypothetical protein